MRGDHVCRTRDDFPPPRCCDFPSESSIVNLLRVEGLKIEEKRTQGGSRIVDVDWITLSLGDGEGTLYMLVTCDKRKKAPVCT